MVVVNFRGTSGSGKTFAARRIMELYPRSERSWATVMGKTRQMGHLLMNEEGVVRAVAMGKYDGAKCGGCDSMSWKGAANDICAEVVRVHRGGYDVILEGLMVSSWGTGRLRQLSMDVGGRLHVLQLNTSLSACLSAVADRRRERGDERPLDPKNTESKWRSSRSGSLKMRDLGMHVEFLDREAAFQRARELLGV